jgi:hypothetical protein
MLTHNPAALAERIAQAFSLNLADVEREMADIDGIDAPADYDSAAFTFDPFVA